MIRKAITAVVTAVILVAMLASSVGAAQESAARRKAAETTDELFAPWARSDSPGCALATARDGHIVHEHAYGMADLEQGVALRPDAVFNVASISKQFTTTAVLLLVEDGKLSLDDDVRKYIPELRDYGTTITLRHLGYHTSGLRDYAELLGLAGWNWVDEVPTARALDLISRQRSLNFEPGSRFKYSNTGYLLLAQVVQRVSGQSLASFARQRIFEPLGMAHSRFYDDRRMIVSGRATGYLRKGEGALGAWRPTYEVVGDGGLLTTTHDLALWAHNFIEPRLGRNPRQLVSQLTEPGRLNDGSTFPYAFGVEVEDYRGLPTVGHGGSIPGYAAFTLLFPEQRFSVHVLCNQGGLPARRLATSTADAFLDGQLRDPPTTALTASNTSSVVAGTGAPTSDELAHDELSQYVGDYYSDELDATYVLRADGGVLTLQVGYLPFERLAARGRDRFQFAGKFNIEFTRNRRGTIAGLRLGSERIQGIDFVRAK